MKRPNTDSKKFQVATEFAFDHIVITDKDGTIAYANKAAELATGYSIEEMIGATPKLWGGLMPPEFYKELWHVIRDLKQPFVGEIVNRRKTGETYTAELHISPIMDKNNEIAHFVGIERDVTKLRELDSSRLEFVTLASHQLRTPLSTMSWYSEVLLSGDIGKQTPAQENYTREMYKATQRMISLVNDLLNLSRIDMGKISIQLTEFNVSTVLRQVIHEHNTFMQDKKIKLKLDIPKSIKMTCDEQLLRNIFANLISNAIKYTPPEGRVEIRVTQEAKNVVFVFSDSGYGIPTADRHKIFSKFFRADNVKARSSDGTGLGLYIVKAFTDNLGGTIAFKSTEKEGTEFTLTIPRRLNEKKS